MSNFCPAMAVPTTVKMPEPMTAPMPSAVSDHGPSVFFSRCSGLLGFGDQLVNGLAREELVRQGNAPGSGGIGSLNSNRNSGRGQVGGRIHHRDTEAQRFGNDAREAPGLVRVRNTLNKRRDMPAVPYRPQRLKPVALRQLRPLKSLCALSCDLRALCCVKQLPCPPCLCGECLTFPAPESPGSGRRSCGTGECGRPCRRCRGSCRGYTISSNCLPASIRLLTIWMVFCMCTLSSLVPCTSSSLPCRSPAKFTGELSL